MAKWRDIQDYYGRPMEQLLNELYVKECLSSYEVAERIKNDMGIDYSYRQVERWLHKYNLLRTHAEAMKHRVITGRMDYSARKLDYEGRYIDYGLRDKIRGYRWAVGLYKFLNQIGDNIRLAKALGSEEISISSWKNLRYRVSADYQDKICAYFGVDNDVIFSDTKNRDVPSLGMGGKSSARRRLKRQGYKYATKLEDVMHQQGLTKQDLADKLNKPLPSISRWCDGAKLVSPTEQMRVENLLNTPTDEIFTNKKSLSSDKQ